MPKRLSRILSVSCIQLVFCFLVLPAFSGAWEIVRESPPAGNSFIEKDVGPPPAPSRNGNWQTVIDTDTAAPRPVPPSTPPTSHSPSPSFRNQNEPQSPESRSAPAGQVTGVDDGEIRRLALKLIDTLLASNQPARMPPTLFINNMTSVQYAGAVSMALEGMRLFYGDMDEEQQARLESHWRPAFRFPCRQVIDYLNRLNPLLVEFLALRAAISDTIEDFNATQLMVMGATALGDAAGVAAAMDDAAIYALVNRELNLRLQETGKKIRDLGEPPDAGALRKKARQRHEKVFAGLSGSLMTVTPSPLKAIPGVKCRLAVKVREKPLRRFKNLSLKYFVDQEAPAWASVKNGQAEIALTFRASTSHPLPLGSHKKLTLLLQGYPGPKTLAKTVVDVEIIENPGCWVLTDMRVCCRKAGQFGNVNTDLKKGRFESWLYPPSHSGRILKFGYRSSWPQLPRRLRPGRLLQLPVTITRLHHCDITREKFYALYGTMTHGETVGKSNVAGRKKLSDLHTQLLNCSCDSNRYGGCISVSHIKGAVAACWARSQLVADRIEQEIVTGFNQIASADDVHLGCRGQAKRNLNLVVPKGIHRDRYDKTRKYHLRLYLVVNNDFFYNKDGKLFNSGECAQVRFGVVYTFTWDPAGNTVTPHPDGSVDQPGNPGNQDPDAVAQAEKKARNIEFHRHNLQYFSANIRRLKKALSTAGSAEARNQLIRDLLYAEDACQRELDAIASIETGTYVHTRTQLDALNMRIMAEESQKLARKWHTIKRINERVPRLIALAPKKDRPRLMKIFTCGVAATRSSKNRLNDFKQILETVSKRVMGSLEKQKQAHADAAEFWDWCLWGAENVKTFADYSLMLLSFAGPSAVYNLFGGARLITASGVFMAYGAGSGFVEGGFREAVSRFLAASNTATIIIDAGMRGYQSGVLRHLDAYARNPQQVKLDEARAGFVGAGWSAGTAAAFAVAVKFGMKAWQNRQQLIRDRRARLLLKQELVIQEARMRHFRSRQAEAVAKVKVFENCRVALVEAGKAGASRSEIRRLRNEMEEAYKKIKTDLFAKLQMKSLARVADFRKPQGHSQHKTVHAYKSIDRRFTKRLVRRVGERMEAAGFNPQEYKTFSNASSRGGIGADIDLGPVEPPRFILVKGRKVLNPAYPKWRRELTRTVSGQAFRITPQELHKAGQQEFENAFRDIYGCEPREAMLSFTTSYHPEAYRDPAWLAGRECRARVAFATDPKWTQQAADVTDFKINHLGSSHPSLGYYGNLQENCRTLVKDINTKLMPQLEAANNKTAITHIKRLKGVMESFVNNEIGPVEAEHRLRLLTGNADGVVEVSRRFSMLLRGLKKSAAGN